MVKRELILKIKHSLEPIEFIPKHKLEQTISIELPLELPFLIMRQQSNKKDRLGILSMNWILRVGATGFEPAT